MPLAPPLTCLTSILLSGPQFPLLQNEVDEQEKRKCPIFQFGSSTGTSLAGMKTSGTQAFLQHRGLQARAAAFPPTPALWPECQQREHKLKRQHFQKAREGHCTWGARVPSFQPSPATVCCGGPVFACPLCASVSLGCFSSGNARLTLTARCPGLLRKKTGRPRGSEASEAGLTLPSRAPGTGFTRSFEIMKPKPQVVWSQEVAGQGLGAGKQQPLGRQAAGFL